jgi:transcriptional regulator with XRE-family HTH domain
MNALSFLEKHGKDKATSIAEKAGTNYAYFSQIAHGHRRPSVDLAARLVRASEEEIDEPNERLDLLSLLPTKIETTKLAPPVSSPIT